MLRGVDNVVVDPEEVVVVELVGKGLLGFGAMALAAEAEVANVVHVSTGGRA